MSNLDGIGARMKAYEKTYTENYIPPNSYGIVRVDGKAFHTYTKNLKKPYDFDLIRDMGVVAQVLCKEIQGARFAYTQSDEISVFFEDVSSEKSQQWCGGKITKMVSISAAIASANLTLIRSTRRPDMAGSAPNPAYFDSRVFVLPDPQAVVDYFNWRWADCVKNSISMLASAHFSDKQLHGKSTEDRKIMLSDIGMPWFDQEPVAKVGQLTEKEYYDGPNGSVRSRWVNTPASFPLGHMIWHLIPGFYQKEENVSHSAS